MEKFTLLYFQWDSSLVAQRLASVWNSKRQQAKCRNCPPILMHFDRICSASFYRSSTPSQGNVDSYHHCWGGVLFGTYNRLCTELQFKTSAIHTISFS